MGPRLPEKSLHDPSTDDLETLSTHAIDAEEEGPVDAEPPAEDGPKAKRHKTMLRQECKDWLLDFIQYQKKL
eukprot:3509396-Amphidinium_carterae.2